MTDRASKVKRGVRLVRTRQRTPDFVRKAGPHKDHRPHASRRAELAEALQEWAEDWENTHSIFED